MPRSSSWGSVTRIAASFAVALVLGGSSAARAEVHVRSTTPCVDAHETSERLERLLASLAESRRAAITLTLAADALPAHAQLLLEVTERSGTSLLRREYAIAPADCGGVLPLLEAVLTQLVRTLPIEAWTDEAAVVPPAASSEPSGRRWVVGVAPVLLGSPLRGGLELRGGLHVELPYGELVAALVGAAPYEPPLGAGRVVHGLTLVEVGYGLVGDDWQGVAALRTGALWVAGVGYDDSRASGNAWFELGGAVTRRLGAVAVGIAGAWAPVDHVLATVDGARRAVPRFRVGPCVWLTP